MKQTDHAAHIKTVFCDIDGCILKHHGNMTAILTNPCKLLPGVREAFKRWGYKGYTIVLTTGRPESLRSFTNQQLHDTGLFFHSLIMGLPKGQRVVINDMKAKTIAETAACVNLPRNKGMEHVDI